MSELPLHGGDPSVLRRLNSAATLRALREDGEATLSGLAGRVGLSRPTTEGVLADLTARGLVDEAPPRQGAGLGRPARRYRFRAEAGHALGIEIDAHRTRLFLADLAGTVVGRHRADLEADQPPAERLAAVRAAVKTCLADAGIDRRSLRAVAAGTPGVVAPDGVVAFCTVVPGWEGVDLGRELGRSFPCPVLVENDANLAAVAERWHGAAREADDVVCVHAGSHTGIGTLIGGRLHRGRWGAAGEIGKLPELGLYDTTAVLSGAESAGALLDGIAPSGAGARRVLDAAGRAERVLDAAARAERVLDAAGRAEPAASALVAALAERMARGVAAMALALDPEMIVVGGPLVRPGGPLVPELRRRVRPLCLSPVRIEASTLGDEAVGLGAVRLALDRIDEDLFSLDRPAQAPAESPAETGEERQDRPAPSA
ncbi:ROK family transcriptional regulator [Actinomadura xylanilytica]|uniref:ROK family transcriptional regulator n=1 Tax=Actinomadura xylanilytica TaxID=887459 RepID=UPI00255AB258|nr:ROK family transcriptional regulator [Actinomadura xylanilytica]MDL4774922.1 ROK family protein [Actinomadura xylanilytica]